MTIGIWTMEQCRKVALLFISTCALTSLIDSGNSNAIPLQYYVPRNSIPLPTGCAFVAHSGQYKTLADICAETLLALDKALKASWLNEECDVDQFRDLKYVTAGVPMNDWFKFIPLGHGRFLIKLVCSIGPYNWWTLVFAYDESHIPREKVGATVPHSLPALAVFPIFHAHYAPSNFTYAINMRDFDHKASIL